MNAGGDNDPERLAELSRVFAGRRAELDDHMHQKEAMLIPAIERFEAAVAAGQPLPLGSFGYPDAVMEQ